MFFNILTSMFKRLLQKDYGTHNTVVTEATSGMSLYDKIEEIIGIVERNSRSLRINVKFHELNEIGQQLTLVSLIEHNMLEGLETVLLTDFDVNYLIRGQAPLHFAIQRENIAMIALLIEHKADLEIQNIYLETPLNCAVRVGYIESIRYLLAQGVEVNTTASDNVTPLAYALREGDIESVTALKEYGAQLGVSYLVKCI